MTAVPGISRLNVQTLAGEIGLEMRQSPTVDHLICWATLCPRLDQSAGKVRGTRGRRGGSWLAPMLIQCGWTAVRSKHTYLRAEFVRLKARLGPKKAIVAVAAFMVTALYHMIEHGMEYRNLGFD